MDENLPQRPVRGLAGRVRMLLPFPRTSPSNWLQRGTFYLLKGEATVYLVEGSVSSVGKLLLPGESFSIPAGKQAPVEILNDSVVRIGLGPGARMQKIPERTVPVDWDVLVHRLAAGDPRTVLILGGEDTGKTFLATYLANRLTAFGRKVAVLDADPGQSVIGPPGTVGFALMRDPVVFLEDLLPAELFFTGASSPGTAFLEYGVGLAAASRQAASAADTVVVNTPGWVEGEGGRLLTRSLSELVSPDMTVLLEREDELGYAGRQFPGTIVRLPVSAAVQPSSSAARRRLREESLRRYFREGSLLEIPFAAVTTERCYFLSGRRLARQTMELFVGPSPVLWAEYLGGGDGVLVVLRGPVTPEALEKIGAVYQVPRVRVVHDGDEEGLAVALKDSGGRTLSLGIVRRIDYRRQVFRIYTPLPAFLQRHVRVIQFGFLRLSGKGAEAGTVRRWVL